MKLLNWAKEKTKSAAKFFGIYLEAAPRFNKTVDSAVMPPDRRRRSETRKLYKFLRWGAYNVGHGCPTLTGMRLSNTAKSMEKCNLLVQPKPPEWHDAIEARRIKAVSNVFA